ncbi:unnamed protein product [Kuraishia capsulata CBS 1993]|uniref:ATPase AAA-type core domain-containing protein n=1 Tax=Kuraishia capsulata CBS 1993 TaxID=1382522 RepID=W6MUE3_9ASCO|nr:uncharacterized protein KUCA_T00005179001 [Kuraishia capsulata CBS 1993]CDK29192.1 unnamed protein product [Kuraishia capsulata CBS 1993]
MEGVLDAKESESSFREITSSPESIPAGSDPHTSMVEDMVIQRPVSVSMFDRFRPAVIREKSSFSVESEATKPAKLRTNTYDKGSDKSVEAATRPHQKSCSAKVSRGNILSFVSDPQQATVSDISVPLSPVEIVELDEAESSQTQAPASDKEAAVKVSPMDFFRMVRDKDKKKNLDIERKEQATTETEFKKEDLEGAISDTILAYNEGQDSEDVSSSIIEDSLVGFSPVLGSSNTQPDAIDNTVVSSSPKEVPGVSELNSAPVEASSIQPVRVSPMDIFKSFRDKDRKQNIKSRIVVMKISPKRLASVTGAGTSHEAINIDEDESVSSVKSVGPDLSATATASPMDIFKSFREKDAQKAVPATTPENVIGASGDEIDVIHIESSDDDLGSRPLTKKTKKPSKSDKQSKKLPTKGFMVTIPISSEKLKTIKIKPEPNPLLSRGNIDFAGAFESSRPSSGYSFFSDVSNRAKEAAIEKGKGIERPWKMKEMKAPVLKKDEFLVRNMEDEVTEKELLAGLKIRTTSPAPFEVSAEETSALMRSDRAKVKHDQHKHYTYTMEEFDIRLLRDIAILTCLDLQKDERFNRLQDIMADPFIVKEMRKSSRQWCDLFAPTRHSELLISRTTRNSINDWIVNAFKRLKSINTKAREAYLNTKKTHDDDDMDFIVDYDEPSDDEVFVPLLILQGENGCGKTSAVYAIAEDELNGHVFEINTGQERAKKDINFHLKQIGTTQTVNAKTESDNTKNGVILFDDCDVVFEELDKDFWSAIRNLMSYSHRPVILTCESIDSIPSSIIDHATIYTLKKPSQRVLKEYLDAVALIMGFKVHSEILEEISGLRDTRKALMQLNLLCSGRLPKHSLCEVGVRAQEDEEIPIIAGSQADATAESSTEFSCKSLEELYKKYDSFDELTGEIPETLSSGFDLREGFLSFYSSRLYRSGSRAKERRFHDSYDFIDCHPRTAFNALSQESFAIQVAPFIRSMASVDLLKSDMNKKRFSESPTFVWDTPLYIRE